jgi:hypothetical protein
MDADLVLQGQCIAARSRHDLGAKENSLLLPLHLPSRQFPHSHPEVGPAETADGAKMR